MRFELDRARNRSAKPRTLGKKAMTSSATGIRQL